MSHPLPPAQPHILRCTAATAVPPLAGSIAKALRDVGCAELRAIGAGAVNQAVKASALARVFLAEEGSVLTMWPAFFETTIRGEERTGVALHYKLAAGEKEALP